MRLALLLMIAACEKQGPVESTPGSSSAGATATPTVKAIDAGVATIGTDAAVTRSPADAAVAVQPDAAVRPPRRDVLAIEDDAARFADQLTALDTGSLNQGDLSSRRPGVDLGRVDDLRDRGNVAVGGGGRGVGDARVGIGTGPKVDGDPTNGPLGRVTISSSTALDATTLRASLVATKITAAYLAGIKRCYKTYLGKDPSARGKVKLSFTVNETGRLVSPTVSGFATGIDECLSGKITSWRFPVPKDKDGEPIRAGFEVRLQFVPE